MAKAKKKTKKSQPSKAKKKSTRVSRSDTYYFGKVKEVRLSSLSNLPVFATGKI